jgi:cell division protein ZapB
MATPPVPFEQVAERVERLLLRHADLRRSNALLAEQVASLTRERDALRVRLHAARVRVDAVLERLPMALAEDPYEDKA